MTETAYIVTKKGTSINKDLGLAAQEGQQSSSHIIISSINYTL